MKLGTPLGSKGSHGCKPHLKVACSCVGRQQGVVQQAAGRHAVAGHAVEHSLRRRRVVFDCRRTKTEAGVIVDGESCALCAQAGRLETGLPQAPEWMGRRRGLCLALVGDSLPAQALSSRA